MKNFLYKILTLFIIMILSTTITSFSDDVYKCNNHVNIMYKSTKTPKLTLLYDNVWATVYHPDEKQCDDSPYLTGDGSKIHVDKINELRWIAISQEMLNCIERQKMLNYNRSELYKGKIKYGDTILISSKHPEINGWWVVHDTKNARIKNSVDFLQDGSKNSLYGKWDDIKIYTLKNMSYGEYQKKMLN